MGARGRGRAADPNAVPAGTASAPAGIPPVGPMRWGPPPGGPPAGGSAAPLLPVAGTGRWSMLRQHLSERAVPLALAGSTVIVAVALLLGATATIAPLVVGYALVAPGLALVRLLRLGEPVLDAVAAIMVSVSIAGLLALAQVYLGLWAPAVVVWVLVGVTAAALAGDPALLPATARSRIGARLAPARAAFVAARGHVAAWLTRPLGWGAESDELALDRGLRARLAGRLTARELRPPVEVSVPSPAARRRRLSTTGRPTTAPDHLLEPPRAVGPTTDGFFGGLIERHEKGERPPKGEPHERRD